MQTSSLGMSPGCGSDHVVRPMTRWILRAARPCRRRHAAGDHAPTRSCRREAMTSVRLTHGQMLGRISRTAGRPRVGSQDTTSRSRVVPDSRAAAVMPALSERPCSRLEPAARPRRPVDGDLGRRRAEAAGRRWSVVQSATSRNDRAGHQRERLRSACQGIRPARSGTCRDHCVRRRRIRRSRVTVIVSDQ